MKNFLKIFFLCLLLLFAEVPAYAQQNIHVFFVGSAIEFAHSVPANTFSGAAGEVYIFSPSPSQSVTFYISNTAASSYSLTYQIFATGNPVVSDYSSNKLYWSALPTWSVIGGFSTSAAVTVTVPSKGTLSISTPQTTGAQIALVLNNSTGTSAQLENMTIVLASQGAIPVSAIQGTAPSGTTPVGNPVYVGGLDKSFNQVQPIPITHAVSGNDFGLDLGNPAGPSQTFAQVRSFGLSGNAALPAYSYAENNQASVFIAQVGGAIAPTQNAQQPNSLFTTTGGVVFTASGTFSSSTFSSLTIGSPGVHSGCVAFVNVSTFTGTGVTANFYIQDSTDNANWNDRISFLQVTPGTNLKQIAAVTGGSINPSALASETLTAGTVVNGNLAPFLRVGLVLAGTTPSITYTMTVTCQ